MQAGVAPISTRRQFLAAAGAAALAGGAPLLAETGVLLPLPGGPAGRPLTSAFPGKGEMILQRTSPPLLETQMAVFDSGILTPNDRFFVRWHWGDFPTSIDVKSWRLSIGGAVARPFELTLAEILALPREEIVAVNQCSGNSRGLFQPRVQGAQWAHGAMGNAKWMGVRLRDLLDRAGLRADAVEIRFGGADKPLMPAAHAFEKSLPVEKARDPETLVAFAMNGEQLPLLNGFPLRLVVPGWYSTYWIKMLSRIEVLTAPDEGYWMQKAYRIPSTPGANVPPGAKGFATIPLSRMNPRSWITSFADGATLPRTPAFEFGGIAMGGDSGVARVDVSADGGRSWRAAALGPDEGRYSFRRFDARIAAPAPGPLVLMSRCTNRAGDSQPMQPNWNPGGFMRNCVERYEVTLA